MTEQEINNLIDSKIGKTKMSQLPEATQTSGLYSIGYNGNQSVKYKANLLQGDPLTVRKTYQTESEALADKNPIDPSTSLPLTVGQFVSIVDDGEKNGIYRIGAIGVDGTMSLELQGKLGDLSEYTKTGGSTKTTKDIDDTKANHGYPSAPKTLKEVEDNASVKIENLVVNGNFENGLIAQFNRVDGNGGESNLAINNSSPISGNYDIRLTIITPAETNGRPTLYGVQRDANIGDKIYLHFYAKILSGTPTIYSIHNGEMPSTTYGGDVINGRNTRIIDVEGTGSVGTIYFRSSPTWDMQMDNFMHINLTETFGAGNEPTKEEMDLLLSTLGTDYFEGELTIPAQNVMQWLLEKHPQSEDKIYEKANHGYASIEVAKTLKEVEDNASVKIKNEVVNGNLENGLISPFSRDPGANGESNLAINNSSPISGNYDIRLTITTPSTIYRPIFRGLDRAANIGDKIYLHFYAKILSGSPNIRSINNGVTNSATYGGDVINGRNTRVIDVEGTGSGLGEVFFRSPSVWDMQMDNFMRINLTETFGAGNEPTEKEMNLLISTLGIDYFEGEITIPAQKIMQWQLNLAKYGIMPLVTIANDDGRATDYGLYQMMQRYGMRGTTFAVGTYVKSGHINYLNEEQVKEMADAGWEIACHSYEHNDFTLETFPDGIIYQILENKKYLESLTGKKVETLAHPFGGTSAEIRNLIRSFYEGARTSTGGYNDFGDVANVYNLKTFWTDTASITVDSIKSSIDALISGKPRHLMLSGHALATEPGGNALTLSEMEEVCDYLKAYQMQGKLEVVTFAEAVRRLKSHPNHTLL